MSIERFQPDGISRVIHYHETLCYYDGIQVFEGRDNHDRFYVGVAVDQDGGFDKFLVVEVDPATKVTENLDNLRAVILNRPNPEWYLMWTNAVTVEPLHQKMEWADP